MPVVFVHGNPETAELWGPLRTALGRTDIVTPRLPGFGAPTPAGWGATRAEYTRWLIGEIAALGEPVDLVGHDWGGGLVMGVAIERPDLLRSWTCDLLGCFHPTYVWHDAAQVWQTAGAGEDAVAGMVELPTADKEALFVGLGVPADIARTFAGALDAEMGRCILALYRSAAQPALANLGTRLAAARQRPGLALIPTADAYTGGPERAAAMAAVAGARAVHLDGVGHWWMFDDLDARASLLSEFWAQA
ncbi:MAG: alpha/beta fold hydrolase [Acidimicrobiales bacterium]